MVCQSYNILLPLISIIIRIQFLDLTILLCQSLNLELSNSFAFSLLYLVSCRHINMISLLTIMSNISIDFLVSLHIFHDPKLIPLSLKSLFTHTRSQKNVRTLAYFSLHPGGDASALALLILYPSHIMCCF